jgi:hypothetical protein
MSEQAQYLRTKIETEIAAFRRRRIEYKRKAIAIKVTISVLAALTTILLGLQGVPPQFDTTVRNVTLVFSATITLLSSLDAFFNHRALYLRYTATTAQLYDLRSDIDYLLSKDPTEITEATLDDIYRRLRGVLEETGSDWVKARREVREEEKRS